MDLKIDHHSSIPLHKQIENILRDLITSSTIKTGAAFPNEEVLAKSFGVSRNTVRQGVYNLVQEGRLVRKRGVGTVVSESTVTTHLDEWHSFTQEMSKSGVRLKNYLVRVNVENADQKIAEALQIEPGTSVVKLERLRGDEAHPFVYFISWFHPRVGLTGDEDFTRPLYEILEKDFSCFPSSSNEELKAIVADKKTAEILEIKQGDAVLLRKRRVCDAGNRLIEYNVGYYTGDKFIYSINIKKS